MLVGSPLVGGLVVYALDHLYLDDGCRVAGCPACVALARLADSGQLEQALAGWCDPTREPWWNRDRKQVDREWLRSRLAPVG